jgi:hypothetical protein
MDCAPTACNIKKELIEIHLIIKQENNGKYTIRRIHMDLQNCILMRLLKPLIEITMLPRLIYMGWKA